MIEPAITKGAAVKIVRKPNFLSIRPNHQNASAELERPKDSVINARTTLCPVVKGVANKGNNKIKNGTNKAEPLIPTVLTVIAISNATGNIHQNKVQ